MAELASTITHILVIARRADAVRINPLHKSRCFCPGHRATGRQAREQESIAWEHGMALHGMSMDASPAARVVLLLLFLLLVLGLCVDACVQERGLTGVRRKDHSNCWIMLGFHSSRDIMTVEPRGWCSGETFYLGLALHRPASWEAGLVRCGLISTTRAGVESLPREPRFYEAPAQQGC